MTLRFEDRGEPVKCLQRGLNKMASLLLVDGHFGAVTRDAVIDARHTLSLPGPSEADNLLQARVAAAPELFPPLTAAGVTFIARAEVSSSAEYRRIYQVPSWPSKTSGITIGIGYDCQFVSRQKFATDWSALDARTLEALLPSVGRVGSEDRRLALQSVVVPLSTAVSVFVRTLNEYLSHTRRIYPQVDHLPPARRTALVSLVYNRGNRLSDRDTRMQDRREMRAIQRLLASGRPDAVGDEFDAMERLWDRATSAGLLKRRHDEAALWRSGFAALQLE